MRGFQDKQGWEVQTDSPTSGRPAFRLACQHAANKGWSFDHIDLKAAFLQGEPYTDKDGRSVVGQLKREAAHASIERLLIERSH